MATKDGKPQTKINVNGNIDGSTFIVGNGNIIGIPIEKFLIVVLTGAIIIQIIGYLCSFVTYLASSDTGEYIVYILGFGFCFPLVFGLPAIYGLIMGYSVKNKKIVMMSLVSGALSLLIICPIFSCGTLFSLAESLGSH